MSQQPKRLRKSPRPLLPTIIFTNCLTTSPQPRTPSIEPLDSLADKAPNIFSTHVRAEIVVGPHNEAAAPTRDGRSTELAPVDGAQEELAAPLGEGEVLGYAKAVVYGGAEVGSFVGEVAFDAFFGVGGVFNEELWGEDG